MKLNTDVRLNLEFDKLLNQISDKNTGTVAKSRIQNSDIILDSDKLKRVLNEIEEAKILILSEGSFPVNVYEDMRAYLNLIEPMGSFLEIKQVQDVYNFLSICTDIRSFVLKHKDKCPSLAVKAENIISLTNIMNLISNTIEPSGAVFDNASPVLKQIRSEIKHIEKQIHIKIERILRKQAEFLQDSYATLRDGRLVLPVREFSVNKIPGIVHGQSGTGQTHFVEPMDVVPLNNTLHELFKKEKKEIIEILKRISTQIRNHTLEILANFDLLCEFDVINAKSKYSIEVSGSSPDISSGFNWKIKNGFHPLLLKKLGKKTVPLNLEIGEKFRELLITGPNAGGKTVALKTVGILQLLFQCGFQVPVREGSEFPVCTAVYSVIGDEQSIENDLSTFSSHITKINRIIENKKQYSLILIDEIGSGTDPSEGSAMAIAVLEALNMEGLVTIATTHHGALKIYAHETPQVSNGAMQFNKKTLTPLFILDVGIPGSSYAFDISRRLGVNENILKRASQLLGASHDNLETIISELTAIKQKYEMQLKEIEIKNSEANGYLALYKTRSEELKTRKKQFEKEALAESRKIVESANQLIENTIREIRESGAEGRVIKKARVSVNSLKNKMSEREKGLNSGVQNSEIDIESLAAGQAVQSIQYQVKGEISKIFRDRKEVEIDANGIKISVPLTDIIVEQRNKIKITPEVNISASTSSVGNEIDLRGYMGEEAIFELSRYLDTTLNSNWSEIRIIHGKGTGALRKHIHAFLKNQKSIKSYRLGKYGEGDLGVTVVEL